jgi:DNA-directed RNA polymerase III subunit RPC2
MYPKAFYLGIMTKRLLEALDDPSKVDKKDFYGNKRMKSAGSFLELLFEDSFKMMAMELKKELNKEVPKQKKFSSQGGRVVDQMIKTSIEK